MQRLSLVVLGLLTLTAAARAQQPSDFQVTIDQGPNPWTGLKANADPQQFQFAIVADNTGRARAGVFASAMGKLNLLQPEFVMSVGDLIEGYTEDEAELDRQWDQMVGLIAGLEMPYFYLPGNHDISNHVQARKWKQKFGRDYYHFAYKGVLFLCINTEDPHAQLGDSQIAYFAKALEEHKDARWTFVFMHQPLWTHKTADANGWDKFDALLRGRQYTVFAGHNHLYTKYVRNDRKYIILSTTGGGIKDELNSPETGGFDHVTWVTVLPPDRGEPRIANLALSGIYDENVRTEATAKLINRVLYNRAVAIEPVLVESDSYAGGKTQLRLINDGDVPMTAKGKFEAPEGVRVEPASFEVNLDAKATRAVPVELILEKPVPVREFAPVRGVSTVTYATDGPRPIVVTREDFIGVDQTRSIPRRTSPVKIDGKLDEWTNLPLAFEKPADTEKSATWAGPGDATYRFAVEHDDNYLYIAVEATDDKAVLNPKKTPWSQDGVEVRLDARPDPARSQGRGKGEFRDILVVSMSPGETREQMVIYEEAPAPEGLQRVCVKTPTGHATEIAVPRKYLDEKQGNAWEAVRVNVAVNDYDEVSGPLKSLWWRPDWRTPKTFAGSGTFIRK
jgi:hypothetical protein